MKLSEAHVVVIGGGFSGQLVQLALPNARLLDWRKTPPIHHLDTRIGPQYLWEPIPNVPSFSFKVTTLVDGEPPTPFSILAYKRKIGKEHDGGDWGLQFQHETTGWHSSLPVPRVEYNRHVKRIRLSGHRLEMLDGANIEYDTLISTIPLDFFLKLCEPAAPKVYAPFRSNPIYIVREKQSTSVDGMILNYLSNPDQQYYRETQVEDELYYESLQLIPGATKIMPGKIHSHPDSENVLRALGVHNVQCFGRFATWRPDELAHETWKFIQAWVTT